MLLPQNNKSIAHGTILLIKLIRPLFGPAECRFFPTCSHFAIQVLETKPLSHAIGAICKRLLCCQPFW